MDGRLIRMTEDAQRVGGGHDSGFWQVDTPWHFHDMHQLLYAFEGAVDVEGRHASYRIPHQFAAWIPAGAVHRTRIQQVASASIFLNRDLVPDGGDHPQVIRAPTLLREMVRQAVAWPLDAAETADGQAYFRCVAVLCRSWLGANVPLTLPTVQSERLEPVVRLTRERLGEVTFGELARAAALSERSLRRRFKAETGITWEEYRRRLQVFLAIEALEAGEAIGTVAARIGYENPAAFARAFRAAIGMSPSEYRRSAAT